MRGLRGSWFWLYVGFMSGLIIGITGTTAAFNLATHGTLWP